MTARPEQLPPTEATDVFIRDCEHKALQRLAKLTASENERVALRACEVLLKYVAQRYREEAQQTSASGGRKPPEGAPSDVSGASRDVSGASRDVSGASRDVSGASRDVSGAPRDVSVSPSKVGRAPSGGLRPPLAGVKTIPHKLLHPTTPKPAFRAVPLGFESPGHSG